MMIQKCISISTLLFTLITLSACTSNQNLGRMETTRFSSAHGLVETEFVGDSVQRRASAQEKKPLKEILEKELRTIYFAFDSTELETNEKEYLARLANVMKKLPSLYVLVLEGHTDHRGSIPYNLKLGSARAKAVREILVKNGVSEKRLRTKSYGEGLAAVKTTKPKELWLNRRVVFKIQEKGAKSFDSYVNLL